MPSKNLVKTLQKAHPDIQFISGELFKWSSSSRVVYYDPVDEHMETMLLHELAHALLEHEDFILDVELVRKEADAWDYTTNTLAQKYSVDVPEAQIDEALESYRYWLHKRSRCPECKNHGLQTKNTHYKCLVCGCIWRANDARVCGLKRYKVTS